MRWFKILLRSVGRRLKRLFHVDKARRELERGGLPFWRFAVKWGLGYLLLAGLLVFLFLNLPFIGPSQDQAADGRSNASANKEFFSALQQRVRRGKVAQIEVLPARQSVRVTERGSGSRPYEVGYPAEAGENGLEGLLDAARQADASVISKPLPTPSRSLMDVLLQLAPVLLIGGILVFILMNSGMLASRRPVHAGASNVSFAEVAGVGEAVQELGEVHAFLKDPRPFEAIGAKAPKGVLLYGPPGTGKTLLAKAIANEAGVPFFACSGSEFVEMFAGLGARRVRSLFEQAKRHAPSLVFIDELDAVGARRTSAGGDGGTREADQTLIEILRQMDGFETGAPNRINGRLKGAGREQYPVIVIGATNRLEALDPALTRPGRFDRHILVDPPDKRGRAEILKVHARNKQISADVDLDMWAAKTAGMTGADLALLLNEAALTAVRRGHSVITEADVDQAFLRVVAGAEKQHRTFSDEERRRVAYHEAGHAIVREKLRDSTVVHRISIIPRGRSGGQTIHVSEEDTFLYSTSKLRDNLAALLGGRAAEELAFGEVSSGAADDLTKASELAERMLARLGMGETLGLRVELESIQLSESQRTKLDEEIQALLRSEYERALKILSEHRSTLESVAEALLAEETIDRRRFLDLLGPGFSAGF